MKYFKNGLTDLSDTKHVILFAIEYNNKNRAKNINPIIDKAIRSIKRKLAYKQYTPAPYDIDRSRNLDRYFFGINEYFTYFGGIMANMDMSNNKYLKKIDTIHDYYNNARIADKKDPCDEE